MHGECGVECRSAAGGSRWWRQWRWCWVACEHRLSGWLICAWPRMQLLATGGGGDALCREAEAPNSAAVMKAPRSAPRSAGSTFPCCAAALHARRSSMAATPAAVAATGAFGRPPSRVPLSQQVCVRLKVRPVGQLSQASAGAATLSVAAATLPSAATACKAAQRLHSLVRIVCQYKSRLPRGGLQTGRTCTFHEQSAATMTTVPRAKLPLVLLNAHVRLNSQPCLFSAVYYSIPRCQAAPRVHDPVGTPHKRRSERRQSACHVGQAPGMHQPARMPQRKPSTVTMRRIKGRGAAAGGVPRAGLALLAVSLALILSLQCQAAAGESAGRWRASRSVRFGGACCHRCCTATAACGRCHRPALHTAWPPPWPAAAEGATPGTLWPLPESLSVNSACGWVLRSTA